MSDKKIITGEYEVSPLEWDSKHFGMSCAKAVIKKQITQDTFLEMKNACTEYDFVTITNEDNVRYNNYLIGQHTNAFLVDVQVVFSKNVENVVWYDDVEISNNLPYNEDVVRIALDNFIHSRFHNDPHINKEKADQVYGKWTESSFNREDRYFAVSKNNGVPEGVFLFAFDENGNCDQGKGFMVVDKKCQGRGVAKRLIESIEAYSFDKGSKLIFGGTQIDNIRMVNHYYRDKYQLTEKKSIYHMWKK